MSLNRSDTSNTPPHRNGAADARDFLESGAGVVVPTDRYLGWNIGGTQSSAIIGNGFGQVIDRVGWTSRTERGPTAMIEEFIAHAEDLLARHKGVREMGVSVGGPLNTERGLILSPPHLPGWDRIDLVKILQARLSLPATIEHDAVACLMCEWLWGAAQQTTHAVYLTCGTGFGAGVLINGQILRGPTGQTPEIGHIRFAADGPMMYGKRGCAESFCSGRGIAKLAHHLFPDRFPTETPVPELLKLAEQGDDQAREVLLASARWTGRACAMLGDMFSPQLIVLGSLARYLPDWWLEEIRREFSAEVLSQNGSHTRLLRAATGKDLQDLSSYAMCVFNRPRHKSASRHNVAEPRPSGPTPLAGTAAIAR